MRIADDPTALDLVTAGRRLRAGELSSVALTEGCLAQIAARNDELRAFITVTADAALAAAREADREFRAGYDRGPLQGIPISLKDLIDVAGVPTTAGSRVTGNRPARADAVVTARLKAAGAVLVGKTNLHEFAFGTTSEDTAFGAVRNPLRHIAIGRRLERRVRRIGGDRHVNRNGRHRHRRIDPHSISGVRPRRVQARVWRGALRRRRPAQHDTGSCRAACAHGRGRGGDVPRAGALCAAVPGRQEGRRPSGSEGFAAIFEARLEPAVRTGYEAALESSPRPAWRLSDVDDAARAGHRGHLPRHRAAGGVRVPCGDAASNAPSCTRLPCASGSRWAATSSRKTTFARGRGQEVLRRDVEAALADVDALVLPRHGDCAAPPLGAETVAIDGVAEPVRALMLRLTQPFNVSGHPAIVLPCGTTAGPLPSQPAARRHRGASGCSTSRPASRTS